MAKYTLEEKPPISLSPSIVDLFCGAGGLSEGFRQAGFRIVGGLELDPDATATYTLNIPEAEMILGDVRDPKIRARVVELAREVDVVVGGPPCQGFSQVRNHTRFIDDPRNALYREFVYVIENALPHAFVMENVTGIDQMDIRDQIARDLSLDGEYEVVPEIHDAVDFGVPQTRRRLLFVGIHRSLGTKPPQLHGTNASSSISLVRQVEEKGSVYHILIQGDLLSNDLPNALRSTEDARIVTASQAISDLIGLRTGRREDVIAYAELPPPESAYQRIMREEGGDVLHNVQVPRMNEDTRLRLEAIPPGGNYRDLEEALMKRYLTGQRWGQDNGSGRLSRRHFYAYRRLHPEIWAWTLNTKADAVYHYLHPRSLSVREFARLQSFPDRYVFTTDPRKGPIPGRLPNGPAHSRYRQVGNAVPPRLASAIAKALLGVLEYASTTSRQTSLYSRRSQKVIDV